jgi:hypothetical protein
MTSREFCLLPEWKSLRKKVLFAFGKRCMKCNKLFNSPHVDHIKPRSRYQHLQLEITNLQVLCKKCNQDKSDINTIDYRTESQKKASIDGLTYQCLTLKTIFIDKVKIIEIGDIDNNRIKSNFFVRKKTSNSIINKPKILLPTNNKVDKTQSNKPIQKTVPTKKKFDKRRVKTFSFADSVLLAKQQREARRNETLL